MSWGHITQGTEIGTITLAYVECDECHTRWPDDSAHPHYELNNKGFLSPAAFDYLHFCSIECLGRHFDTDTSNQEKKPE